MNNFERASVLSEALPYIKAFSKKTIVVKYDGNAVKSDELKRSIISDIVLLSLVGVRIVVVHGGNVDASGAFETVDKIGKELVSLITLQGGKALGICGLDGSLFTAEKLSDGGSNGEIKSVNPELVNVALDNGYIPVISTIAQGVDTDATYSVNTDAAAAELAVSMDAKKLVLLTNVAGVCNDANDESTLLPVVQLSDVPLLVKNGVIAGDMASKVDCCVKAIRRGVARAHILDGRVQHSILVEILTDSGVGTMIMPDYKGYGLQG